MPSASRSRTKGTQQSKVPRVYQITQKYARCLDTC